MGLDLEIIDPGESEIKLKLVATKEESWELKGSLSSALLELGFGQGRLLYSLADSHVDFTLNSSELTWQNFSASFLEGSLEKGEGRFVLSSKPQRYEGTVDYKDLCVEDWPAGSEGAPGP